MTKGMDWNRHRLRGLPTEAARPKDKRLRGAWTHVAREPVKTYSREEIEAWSQADGRGEDRA